MKGISVIIATIILVVITIGLVATAYIYISGLITSSTAKNIELVHAFCYKNETTNKYDMTLIVKNIGTTKISTSNISVFVDGKKQEGMSWSPSGDLSVGDSASVVINQTIGYHDVSIVGPSNSISVRVQCA